MIINIIITTPRACDSYVTVMGARSSLEPLGVTLQNTKQTRRNETSVTLFLFFLSPPPTPHPHIIFFCCARNRCSLRMWLHVGGGEGGAIFFVVVAPRYFFTLALRLQCKQTCPRPRRHLLHARPPSPPHPSHLAPSPPSFPRRPPPFPRQPPNVNNATSLQNVPRAIM